MASNNEFKDRLQYLIDTKKIHQRDLAQKLGINEARVSDWVRGAVKKPQRKTLAKLADVFGCDINWLATGIGNMKRVTAEQVAELPDVAGLVRIPLLGRVPAGIPESIEEYIQEYISIPGAPPNSYALKVTGESMEPEIRHGDYILFVVDRDAKPGDVVVVNDEFGDSMIKRLKEKDGEYFLVSDNPSYPTVSPNGDYRIMGVVVGGWRALNFT